MKGFKIGLILLVVIGIVATFSILPGCKATTTETTAAIAETTAAIAETTAAIAETTAAGASGTVKAGGTLIVRLDSEPLGLDYATQSGNAVLAVGDLFNDYLWRWNKDFSDFVPHVAENWRWTDDTHFKVNLRKGVKFHNGREVVADDVKYSLDRILDPTTASTLAAFVEPIKEVKVDDTYSLTIEVKQPWFGLMDVLTQIAIIPQEEVATLKTNPVGCGPFVFESWESGLQIKAKKFVDYYMTGKPYLDEIVVKFIPEYNTAKSALIKGDLDLIVWPNNADYESLKSNKNLELFPYSNMAVMYVGINTEKEPLDNIKVRQAISLAIDRNAFNKALYQGQAAEVSVPLLKNSPYYKAEWDVKRDVEQAKKLLTEAGYPNGFKIRILALKGNEAIMGEVLYSNLQDIGIQGEIETVEIPIGIDRILKTKDFDFCVLGDTISPDPDFFASKYLIGNGQMAAIAGNWDNAEVDKLIAEGRGTIDEAKRKEIYQKIFDIVLQENPMYFLTNAVRFPVFQKYVKDFFPYGDIRYNWEEIWLDK